MKNIGAKFHIAVTIAALASCALVLFRTYTISKEQARRLVGQQATIALDFELASRGYVADIIRPTMARLVPEEAFVAGNPLFVDLVARDGSSVFVR